MSLRHWIKTKNQMRVIGVLGSTLCFCLVVNDWYGVATEGVYHPKISLLFPFFTFLMLSVVFNPITTEECLERYGSEHLSWANMPLRQKLILITGIIAGIVNWALIGGSLALF